jgi:hypothetical protein
MVFTDCIRIPLKMQINRIPLIQRVWTAVLRTVGILLSLYLFICSLTFLSSSFRILGGRNLSGFFAQSELLSNPVVGVMIGILVTVSISFRHYLPFRGIGIMIIYV